MGPQQNRCGMFPCTLPLPRILRSFNGAATKSLRNAYTYTIVWKNTTKASMGPQQNRCGMPLPEI